MNRKITSICLCLVLALCSIAVSAEVSGSLDALEKSSSTLGFVRTVSKDGTVWLRSGGGMSYPAIGYTDNGDSLIIRRRGNYWYYVTLTSGRCKGMTGWMYSRYIDQVNLKSKSVKNGWGAMARIRDKYAFKTIKLRSGPGSWYASRGTVDPSEPIIILSKATSSWYIAQIGYTRKYGYIYKPFIANGATAEVLVPAEMHKRASASSAILDMIELDEEFLVKNVQSKWSKIEFEGVTGYVRNAEYDFQ